MSALTPEQEARVREIVAEVLLTAVRDYLWRERIDISQLAEAAIEDTIYRANGRESYEQWKKSMGDDPNG